MIPINNRPRRGEEELLLVASSARFLAEAAAACGRAFSSVDGFADAEVRSSARCAMRAALTGNGPDPAGGSLDGESALAACERLIKTRRLTGTVVGPGLDAHPELISRLASRLALYGNAPQVFALCADRRRFDERLRDLGIPRPDDVADDVGDDVAGDVAGDAAAPVLFKQAGCGGAGVSFTAPRGDVHRQPYLPGVAVSHLFLANRTGVASVGWNTQWPSRHDHARPFCYGGAINRSALSGALRAKTEDYAARLARELPLSGINAADYVLLGGELYLLELNPRPSATMQLYESGALFAAHLDACRSPNAPLPRFSTPAPRAHAVIYAPHALEIPPDFAWPAAACDLPAAACDLPVAACDLPAAACDLPDGACDLPGGAVRLEHGDPVCTLTAAAASAAAALENLQRGVRSLIARLDAARNETNETGGAMPSEAAA